MNLKRILTIGLVITSLTGCFQGLHSQVSTKPPVPKPVLVVMPNPEGGICLDKENAIKLGGYILQLEESNK